MPLSLETEPLADATAGLKPGEIALVDVRHDPNDEPHSPVTLYGGGMEDETIGGEGEAEEIEAASDVVGVALEDSTPTDRMDENGNPLHEVNAALKSGQMQIPSIVTRCVDDPIERLREIAHASRELSSVREKIVIAAGEVKALKEEEKGLSARLLRLTAAVANDSLRPLFMVEPHVSVSASEIEPSPADDDRELSPEQEAIFANPNEGQPLPDANAWRAYRFDDPNHFPSLVQQKAIVAKLAEAGIETVGQMVDFQSTGKEITDVKGIGTGKAEKISDAMETFWREHPDLVQSAVDAS